MLNINFESCQTPEMIFVRGEYNNKPFAMNHYLNGSIIIFGNFTQAEKEELETAYINTL